MGKSQTVLHDPQIGDPATFVEMNTERRFCNERHHRGYACGARRAVSSLRGPKAADELISEELRGWHSIAPPLRRAA